MKRVVGVTLFVAVVAAAAWSFAAQHGNKAALARLRKPRSACCAQQRDVQAMSPDSLNVRLVGTWPFGPSEAIAYDSVRTFAFCGSGAGVHVLDVSDPSLPVKLSEEIHSRGTVQGLFYQANRLYIACDVAGIEIWDVTDLLKLVNWILVEMPLLSLKTMPLCQWLTVGWSSSMFLIPQIHTGLGFAP